MGGKGSSSKAKSSKRKRDKTSSQKKSRRKESKKHRRVHDSVSSYSDDKSLNSEHTSSPISKSDHKKRINKNKKLRRDYSLSSSSDDHSVSSILDTSSTYDNVLQALIQRAIPLAKVQVVVVLQIVSVKRNKVILDNERERPRGRESYKARKKRKVRSPSYSSCDEDSKHSISVGHRDGALSPVKNPRRLKSVIAIADQRYDEGENIWEKDPQKEEIVYDRNDYPSPKSLDSNEGGNKMELDNHYYGASSKRIGVENVAGEEGKSEGDQDNGSGDHHSEAANTNNIEKGKEMDTSVLESILRQKALENLKKFKGRLQTGPRSTNPKTNNESDVNKSSAQRVDDVQNESTEQGSFNARETNKNSGPSLQRNLSQLTEVKKLPDGKYVEKEPEMAAQTVEHTFNGTAVLGCLEEDKNGCSNAGLAKPSDTSLGAGTTNACSSSMAKPSSSVGPMSEEHSLEQGNEAKDGSQFKEKTMSVMRGGEMVQVSYKVYIPKKALLLPGGNSSGNVTGLGFWLTGSENSGLRWKAFLYNVNYGHALLNYLDN
ncbi:hypothetical protein DH2020_031646 [Rehmannia glutinosa]|uniref:Uncharacterized protein n=1 Tax=Rehmannia glutinosa TaxID=99300 RepID=A0ABR0VI57_REHGL